MTSARRYATPAAFRAALTARIKDAGRAGPWTFAQLQRQVAYDRFLERLYLVDDGWVVKGATALLARDIGVRGSLDIDLYRVVAREVAEGDLRRAAAIVLDDWFRFEIGAAATAAKEAVRFPLRSLIGATTWVQFHVDLLGEQLRMTGQPDEVPALARQVVPDLAQRGYRAYPLVDHVADKTAATFERYGQAQRPSTRYRDLVDLVAIAGAAEVDATAQTTALRSEFARRDLRLPTAFDVPDLTLWQRGYAAEARRSLLTRATTLDDALDIVKRFLDPVLDGTAHGAWNPRTEAWQ